MNKEKWNDVWKIMENNSLEFDDQCNNEILCIICEKVLIDAHFSPCGCQYCLECITKYLNGEEKICPGNTDYCKQELLNINRNIQTDQPMNRKIMEVIVKCPQKNCDFKDKLINIEDHMRTCNSRSIECPYLNIGCKEYNIEETDVKKHMLMEIVSHTKLLFEFIDNLKNEIKVIKEDKVELQKNNSDLMKYINDIQLKYENENKEIKEMLKAMEKKSEEEQKNGVELKKKMKVLSQEIESMKEDLHKNKRCIVDSTLKCESDNREIKEKLKESQSNEEQKNVIAMTREIKTLNEEMKSLKKDTSKNKRETSSKINEINKIITDLKSISNESDKSISNVVNQMKVLQMNQGQENCGEFVWCIDKWRDKTEHARTRFNEYIYSGAFFSHRNGYKMYLSVYPNGICCEGTHLSIGCGVMCGKCDDILPWPLKLDVTFELINQHTLKIHTTSTLRYDGWYERRNETYYYRDGQKPKDSYLICYNNKFISLEELSNNRSLVDKDQIFIRCRVTIID